MIIKEKRWLSRLVAMLCVLTMVVGVLTPASVGVAAISVKKIILDVADGYIWYEDNNEDALVSILEGGSDYVESGNESYKYKYADDDKTKIEVVNINENTPFQGSVSFYLETSKEPKVVIQDKNIDLAVSYVANGRYKVTVTRSILKNINDDQEVNIQVTLMNSVTYSVGEGCNVTNVDGKSLSGQTIAYDGEVKFKASLDADLRDLKDLDVNVYDINGEKVNGETVNESNGTYTIESIADDRKIVVKAIDKKVNITLASPAPEGYTCTIKENTKVTVGNDYSFYVVPADGYKVPIVEAKNLSEENVPVEYVGNNMYIIYDIKKDVEINIKSTGKYQYDVIYADGTGYTITDSKAASGVRKVNHGEKISFTVEADTGYDITIVTANGTVLESTSDGNGKQYSTTITENTTISVTVKKQLCSVSYTKKNPEEYKLTKGIEGDVEFGSTCTFYVVPNPGYNAPTVEVNNKKLEPVNGTEYVTTITEKTTTIKIIGNNLKKHNIKYSLVDGCEIYDEPVNEVTHGADLNFSLKVVKAYNQSVPVASVDGMTYKGSYEQSSDDESKIYKFNIPNITSDQIVLVSGIQKNIYTVTLKDGTGYSITTTETTNVSAGSTFRFKVNKKDGYQGDIVVQITGTNDKATYNEETDYYSVAVNDNITISVNPLTKATYTYKLTGEHVSIKNVDGETIVANVEHGGSLKFKVDPEDYYQVIQVAINGEPKTAVNEIYTVNNVTDTVDITVTTRANTLTVHYVDDKYNKSKTVKYSVEYSGSDGNVDSSSGKVTLMEPLTTSNLYKFESWSNEGVMAEDVKIDTTKDTELTLTADWKLNVDKIKENIKLTTSASWGGPEAGYTYTIKFRTDFSSELDEEYRSNIKVTGVGTLYSNTNIPFENDNKTSYIEQITNRSKDSDELSKQVITDRKIYNFYKNYIDEGASMLENKDYISLRLGSDTKEIQRYGLGWVELTINGETVILFSSNEANINKDTQ